MTPTTTHFEKMEITQFHRLAGILERMAPPMDVQNFINYCRDLIEIKEANLASYESTMTEIEAELKETRTLKEKDHEEMVSYRTQLEQTRQELNTLTNTRSTEIVALENNVAHMKSRMARLHWQRLLTAYRESQTIAVQPIVPRLEQRIAILHWKVAQLSVLKDIQQVKQTDAHKQMQKAFVEEVRQIPALRQEIALLKQQQTLVNSDVSFSTASPSVAVPRVVAIPKPLYIHACRVGFFLGTTYSVNELAAQITGVDVLERTHVKPLVRKIFRIKKADTTGTEQARLPKMEMAEKELFERPALIDISGLLPPQKVATLSCWTVQNSSPQHFKVPPYIPGL